MKKNGRSVINEWVITKAIAEAVRVAIQTNVETQSQRSEGQLSGPALKQPQLNWEAADKYTEWKAFILEVRNVLSTYNAQEQDKIAIVKTGRQERVTLSRKLNGGEKQVCNTLQGLCDTLAAKFGPQFNETIKLLQFRKLCRLEGESAEELMW